MSFKNYYTGNKVILYATIVKNGELFIALSESDNTRFILYDENKNTTVLPITLPIIQSTFFKELVCDSHYNIYVINMNIDTMNIISANGNPLREINIKNPTNLYRVNDSIYCLNQITRPSNETCCIEETYLSDSLCPGESYVDESSCVNEDYLEESSCCEDAYTLSKYDPYTGSFNTIISNINYILGFTGDSKGNLYLCFFPKDCTTIVKKYSNNGSIINEKFISYSSECFLINIITDKYDNIFIYKLEKGDYFTNTIDKYNSDGVFVTSIYTQIGTIYLPNSFVNMALDQYNNFYYSENTNIYKYTEDEVIPDTIPISNICFTEDMPINTDQGIFLIKNINPYIHTIRNRSIISVTKTITHDNYLVCFEKHSLSYNYPYDKTVMTSGHKIFYKGNLIEAGKFLGKFDNVYKVKYNGEILYNILMEKYDLIQINNFLCETLHPNNIISKIYLSNIDDELKQKIVITMNTALKNGDYNSYNKILSYL